MNGFTLLETLIAVVLLGLIGVAAMRSVHYAGQQLSMVRYTEEAQRVSSLMLREVVQAKKIPDIPSGRFEVQDGEVQWQINSEKMLVDDVPVVFVALEYVLANGTKSTLSAWFAGVQ